MRTETIKIYKFEELSKEVQEKVIEKERENQWENSDNYEWIMETILEELKERGFPTDNAYWDFQYHSLSFEGTLEIDELIKYGLENIPKEKADLEELEELLKPLNNYTGLVTINHRWELEFEEMDSQLEEYEEQDGIQAEVFQTLTEKIKDRITNIVENIKLEKEKAMLEDETYYESDEYLKEKIECNEYEFLENGERHN